MGAARRVVRLCSLETLVTLWQRRLARDVQEIEDLLDNGDFAFAANRLCRLKSQLHRFFQELQH